jgi:hypothetical protein
MLQRRPGADQNWNLQSGVQFRLTSSNGRVKCRRCTVRDHAQNRWRFDGSRSADALIDGFEFPAPTDNKAPPVHLHSF